MISRGSRPAPKMPILNPSGSAPTSSKKKIRLCFWLLTLLILIETGALVFLFLTRPASPYQSLIPAESVSVIYFNQSSLTELTKSLQESQSDWPPLAYFKQIIEGFSDKANLKITELQPLFADKMALIWLPGTDNPSPQWLWLATRKLADAEFEATLEKAQKNLKQNFNLLSEVYRQNTIITIKPLNQDYSNLYFTRLKNLFLLSNNVQAIKNTIDKALKNF